MNLPSQIIFDFTINSNLSGWTVVTDDVMGGRSTGTFQLDEKGNGVFTGDVSLENNGGFSMLRYRFKKVDTKSFSKILLRIKGDGKSYQFRVKSQASDSYAYIKQFKANNDWETVEINLKEMYPALRGRNLDMPYFSGAFIEEVAFFIGNKKAEGFKLKIDQVLLK